ncbi:MAG: methyltransferase domain-containing protein [Bradyrhizobium sp.]|nr:methyltransferase domain-containing protein [Bradyrhizobium sp.]
MPSPVSGTEGYAHEAEALIGRYENMFAAALHAPVLHLISKQPGKILDIGAGTGRDAAWFAAMGHHVVAVEPTAPLRNAAIALHPSPRIEWLDDRLPDLDPLRARGERFDLVMLTGVWMHLDEAQRDRAMPNLAALTKPGAAISMMIRHGPVPSGRRMFEVSADETIRLAAPFGLYPALNLHRDSAQVANRRTGVTWTTLGLVKAALP